jgi:flavin reductase (DIM6/NTAB) family NADH-FMN oxidoreductase RutF
MFPVDAQSMKNLLRYWASGVTVVTSQHEGQRGGVTVSAFNSLSVEPPQIIVCLNQNVSSLPLLQASGLFVVNILANNQTDFSDLFGGRVPLPESGDRFEGIAVETGVTGAPILPGTIGFLECRVKEQHFGDTHWIIVGEVVNAAVRSTPPQPLVYFNRKYRNLDSYD